MVISRVDRHILREIAAGDGIRCGLLEIAEKTGCDYRNAHRRLRRLERAGLVRVDRRGRGKRLIIRLEAAAILLTISSGCTRGAAPIFVSTGLQHAGHYEQ